MRVLPIKEKETTMKIECASKQMLKVVNRFIIFLPSMMDMEDRQLLNI